MILRPGEHWVEPTRILLIDMPRMLRETVRHVVGHDPQLLVVAELDRVADVEAAARTYDPQVIITDPRGCDRAAIVRLLDAKPRIRVLTIEDDGRRGVLHRLTPEALPLGDLSRERLLEALHG
jgi:DNA-binding NarL/FixJ family response regulator